ncbi:pyridoxamine 5'-phosphate oxidase family protein [Bradyrhizobium sp. USDA 10063]
MTRAELHAVLRKHRLAVVSTIGPASPQAAVVGIAVTETLDIVFDTLSTSRKYANLRADPRVALVIGWDAEQTVQYEGIADLPAGADLDACKQTYFATWPDGREREQWPDIAYVRIRPRWVRYSDFAMTPPRIEEMRMA